MKTATIVVLALALAVTLLFALEYRGTARELSDWEANAILIHKTTAMLHYLDQLDGAWIEGLKSTNDFENPRLLVRAAAGAAFDMAVEKHEKFKRLNLIADAEIERRMDRHIMAFSKDSTGD